MTRTWDSTNMKPNADHPFATYNSCLCTGHRCSVVTSYAHNTDVLRLGYVWLPTLNLPQAEFKEQETEYYIHVCWFPPPSPKNVSHSTATAIRREKAVNNLGVQTCRGSSVLMDNNVQAIQYISRKKKLLPRLSQGTLNRQDFSCLAFLCCRDLSSFLVDQYPLVGGRKT
jgi:hypothetical protein